MRDTLQVALAALLLGCGSGDPTGDDDDVEGGVWGQEALDYVTENLVADWGGAWTLSGLDVADEPAEQFSWVDEISASNPRIEDERALVDVLSLMDGGTWTAEQEFLEGVMIQEDGSVGDYFIDMDGEVTIVTETSPGVWEYEDELSADDLSSMVNVTSENLIQGSKHVVKLVTYPDGLEHHAITTTTRVEYDAGAGPQLVEFVSLEGHHQRVE